MQLKMFFVDPDHFIFYKPKDVVSGDFYWIKEINSNWEGEKLTKEKAFEVSWIFSHFP